MQIINAGQKKFIPKLSSNQDTNRDGRIKMRGRYFYIVTMVFVLITLTHPTLAAISATNVAQPSDTGLPSPSNGSASDTSLERCDQNLNNANTDNDNSTMSADEFVNFIKLESNNLFSNVTTFQELPLEIIQIFNFLACNCASKTCCEAYYNNSAAGASVNLSKLTNSTSFCTEVSSTLESLIPTASPTPPPTSQQSPTALPTNQMSTTSAPLMSPTAAPTKKVSMSSPQPTLFSGLENVEISFIGCNINNYTTQDVTSGENNDMIAIIEAALQNLSSSVVMRQRKRRRMGYLKVYIGFRQLREANNSSATVLSAKHVECTNKNNSGPINFSESSCPSCLQLLAAITMNLDEQGTYAIQEKLFNAIKSNGLDYPGFQPTPISTLAPTPTTVVIKPQKLSTAALVGISFAAFAAGFLTIIGLYKTWKRHARYHKDSDFEPSPQSKASYSETVESHEVKEDKLYTQRDTMVKSQNRADLNQDSIILNTSSIDSTDLESSPVDSCTDVQLIAPAAGAATQAIRNLGSIVDEENSARRYIGATDTVSLGGAVDESPVSQAHITPEIEADGGATDTISLRGYGGDSLVSQANIDAEIEAYGPATVFSAPIFIKDESSSDESDFIDIGTTYISTSWNSRSSSMSYKRPILAEVNTLVQQTVSDDISSVDEGGFTDIGTMDMSTSWNSRTSNIGYKGPAIRAEHTALVQPIVQNDDELIDSGTTNVSATWNSRTSDVAYTQPDIRAEVKTLVQRVVPDEVDNLDEMMNQFKGREEELLETLRSMHERDIAQRERKARNNSARIEAKREVQLRRRSANLAHSSISNPSQSSMLVGVNQADMALDRPENVIQEGHWEAVGTVAALARDANRSFERKASGHSSDSSLQRKEKQAVEERDWEAVGTAAASYYDNRSTNQFSEPKFYHHSSEQVDVTQTDVVRDHLEKAIEVGNWEAVGAVAALMSDATSLSSDQESSGYSLESTSYKLKKAIEERDWEAVGMAAVLMNDDSEASRDTQELHHLSEYESSGYASASSSRSATTSSSVDPDRASVLDSMIDVGDWTGVVLAVKGTGEGDVKVRGKKDKSKNWRVRRLLGGKSSSEDDSDGNEASKNVAGNVSQEEKDALAQADMWMAVASQSKRDDVKVTEGAKEAANWAIERSLSALQSSDPPSSAYSGTGTDVPREY